MKMTWHQMRLPLLPPKTCLLLKGMMTTHPEWRKWTKPDSVPCKHSNVDKCTVKKCPKWASVLLKFCLNVHLQFRVIPLRICFQVFVCKLYNFFFVFVDNICVFLNCKYQMIDRNCEMHIKFEHDHEFLSPLLLKSLVQGYTNQEFKKWEVIWNFNS